MGNTQDAGSTRIELDVARILEQMAIARNPFQPVTFTLSKLTLDDQVDRENNQR